MKNDKFTNIININQMEKVIYDLDKRNNGNQYTTEMNGEFISIYEIIYDNMKRLLEGYDDIITSNVEKPYKKFIISLPQSIKDEYSNINSILLRLGHLLSKDDTYLNLCNNINKESMTYYFKKGRNFIYSITTSINNENSIVFKFNVVYSTDKKYEYNKYIGIIYFYKMLIALIKVNGSYIYSIIISNNIIKIQFKESAGNIKSIIIKELTKFILTNISIISNENTYIIKILPE